jgi:hypothetical protein
MKSPTFQFRTIAPVAVALSLGLAMAANAQTASSPVETPQLIVSSPSPNGTLTLFQSQEPVIDPAEFADEAKGWNNEAKSNSVVADKSVAETRSTTTAVATEKPTVPAAETTFLLADKPAAPESTSSEAGQATTSSTRIEAVPDLTPVSLESTISTEQPRAIAASTTDPVDAGDAPVQLRGAAAPNTASTGNDTAGDTTLRQSDIAQSVPTDTTGGTGTGNDPRDFDLTPVSLPRRTPSFNRFEGMQSNALYFLPGRMFFSAIVDNSLRAETNVFQTNSRNRTDMIYRVLPNTTIGYALTRSTRVSANYFFLRDQYTKYKLLDRNFHSVGFQIDQDLYSKPGMQVTAGFMGRALFATPDEFSSTFFNDLLPSITASKQIGQHAVVYGSVLGQIRFREVLNKFQEGDQFYSLGTTYRRGPWQGLLDFTLNNNFGNSNLRQGENNQVIILTEEIARRIPFLPKLPVDAYVRAQQIFNMGANSSPGYAGINTRIFGGIRAYVTKPVIFPVKLAGK